MFWYKELVPAFKNKPASEYQLIYQAITDCSWPVSPVTVDCERSSIWIQLPGTEENIIIETPKFDMFETVLESLRQAVRLSGDVEPKPVLLEAIADVNSWIGNQRAAFESFQALARTTNLEARLRSKIIDYSLAINESSFALEQLKTLQRLRQASRARTIQLADLYALNGAADKAFEILNMVKTSDKTQRAAVTMLLAKTHWLTGNYVKALAYLKSPGFTNAEAITMDTLHRSFAGRYYSIARLNALLKDQDKALVSLGQALERGFAYGYVLETDTAWNALRASAGWNALMKQYAAQLQSIDYRSESLSDLSQTTEYRTAD
jgi:hypothetical protein